jgi:hypothetical protein
MNEGKEELKKRIIELQRKVWNELKEIRREKKNESKRYGLRVHNKI